MKAGKKILSVLLALFIICSIGAASISALTIYVGGRLGGGTVTSAYNRTVAGGVTYSTAVYSGSRTQQIYAMEFNPKTSDYMPLVYSTYSGYGATTINSAQNAESKYGYDVKGGINASFFSMTGSSCNTYGGVNISDGRVIQGCNSNGATYMLVFNSDGTGEFVYSRVAYSLAVNGSAWSGALENINMYPYTTGTGIYYYDTSCGNNTDTNTAGVEVVFEKLNGTELTVGGKLKGRVVAIRSSVSSGGSIGSNQFVLYARNSSQWAAGLRALTVGATAEITVTETIAAAKTKMENASSAFVTYGYHIVSNGVNVTSSNGLGEDFNTARAQRSAIGIKADGTVIILAGNGRTTSYAGLTVYELANLLIEMGCVTGVNLDGGGSTQLTVENSSGNLEAAFSSTRRVANSILIVKRPTISASEKTALKNLIDSALNYLDGYVLTTDSETRLRSAYDYGSSIYGSSKSMQGDYTKAKMRIQEALDSAVITGYKQGIYSFSSAVTMRSSASDSASYVTSVPTGISLSITQVSGDFGYTKYLSYTGWVRINNSTRIGNLSSSKAVIESVDVKTAESDLVVSWNAVPGAASYTYKIIELLGDPDPGNSDESLGAVELAFVETTRSTTVTVPSSLMTRGRHIKVAVSVNYPTGSAWAIKYIQGSMLPFTDVPIDSWYYDAVLHVYDNGLFSGTSPTLFSPSVEMTRAMMVTVLHRHAGLPAVSGTMTFEDVPSNSWYYNAVLWASQNNIVSGYSQTAFGPNDCITREQSAVIMYRYAMLKGYDMSISGNNPVTQFTDHSSISGYALEAVAWAVDKGMINGNNNMINPKSNATRAQIAMLFMNFSYSYS